MASSSSLLRRLTLSVLLPFVLLFAQQGALLHELSHWHAQHSSAEQKVEASGVDSDFCLTCLTFAQVAGLAKFEVAKAPSAPALRYHFASEATRSVADASTPALRSRGPPLFS